MRQQKKDFITKLIYNINLDVQQFFNENFEFCYKIIKKKYIVIKKIRYTLKIYNDYGTRVMKKKRKKKLSIN